MMVKKGKNLVFISQIKRDGSGVLEVKSPNNWMKKEKFRLVRLSISEDTWIAVNFNLYVVRIKK